MIAVLKEAKEKALVEATQQAYKKMYEEDIATVTELDIFHTRVVRGDIQVQETFAVREKKIVYMVKKVKGIEKQVPVVEDTVVFKKINRPPTIKEKQFSAAELYRRNGSYKPLRIAPADSQDDQAAAEKAKSNIETIERCVILSDGTKIPMHG